MKFYEQMDQTERTIMVLEAVQGSVALEGMEESARECQEKIAELRKQQTTRRGSSVQTEP